MKFEKTIIVTGGAGFIGSNFVRYMLQKYPHYKIINLDKLTYAGNLASLGDIEHYPNYLFVQADIIDEQKIPQIFEEHHPNMVVNFAAESHNDRGILNPKIFLVTNVLGTHNLLECCRKFGIERFHHISTCEVYGDLDLEDPSTFHEQSAYNPKTPYNSSKAAADHVVKAYFHTFKVPVTISNCGNNYGPFQHPEKLIPLFATNALEDKHLPLFKSSLNKREWIHVLDHCSAVDHILHHGKVGETYNVGTGVEKSIEEVTSVILNALDKPESLKKYVADRAGHDRRYPLNSSKITRELGWQPSIKFEDGIQDTINWYNENSWWWKPIKEGKFQEYYRDYYTHLESSKDKN